MLTDIDLLFSKTFEVELNKFEYKDCLRELTFNIIRTIKEVKNLYYCKLKKLISA
jgi:hypothetical protein